MYIYLLVVVYNKCMLTNIVIKKETRIKLGNIGRKNQTYDDIINELIQTSEESKLVLVGSSRPTNKDNR